MSRSRSRRGRSHRIAREHEVRRPRNSAGEQRAMTRPRRGAQEVIRVVGERRAARCGRPRRSISTRPRASKNCWTRLALGHDARRTMPPRSGVIVERRGARRGGSRRALPDVAGRPRRAARDGGRRRRRSACRRTRTIRSPSTRPARAAGLPARPTGPRRRRRRGRGDTRAGDRAAGAIAPMPSHARRTRPCASSWPSTHAAVSTAIAKPRPCERAMIAVLTPSTRPRAVEQRAAGVAGVERRGVLDDAVDQPVRPCRAGCGRAPTRRRSTPSTRSRAGCRSRPRADRRAARARRRPAGTPVASSALDRRARARGRSPDRRRRRAPSAVSPAGVRTRIAAAPATTWLFVIT